MNAAGRSQVPHTVLQCEIPTRLRLSTGAPVLRQVLATEHSGKMSPNAPNGPP
jgi:hypothetical protein